VHAQVELMEIIAAQAVAAGVAEGLAGVGGQHNIRRIEVRIGDVRGIFSPHRPSTFEWKDSPP